ncbi:general stress protein [Arthrobacter sp. B0490]|uniref:general stress protein n=1 Tax=Arthrobacter sp. B0490 TaxID=2058891 RepID=UPI0015E40327|nr:general stress protein [Arthrobacter sp. B0490]
MSTPPLGTTASRDLGRVLPTGETIGRYTSYLDAQKAVDYLADNKFAVQRVAIIGNDLKTVERVTGRLSYPRVALASAATGAWFGLFVGLILSLFAGSESGITITSSIALGAIFWLLFGVLTYTFQRGRRDFTSTNQVIATSYDVIVEPGLAADARRLLQQLPMKGQAQHPAGAPSAWAQGPGQAPDRAPGQAPGQAPQQPAPERPAAWNDPYAAPSGQPQQPVTTEDQTAGPGTTGPRRGQFPDLPDGRPQYGVRVEEQTPEDTSPEAAAPADPAGTPAGTGQGAAPGAGRSGDDDQQQGNHGSSAAGGTR